MTFTPGSTKINSVIPILGRAMETITDLEKRLSAMSRDVNETLAYETETFGFWSETRPRPRPCKAETEKFFETFNLQHCA